MGERKTHAMIAAMVLITKAEPTYLQEQINTKLLNKVFHYIGTLYQTVRVKLPSMRIAQWKKDAERFTRSFQGPQAFSATGHYNCHSLTRKLNMYLGFL